jgi:hypothetical protein
VNSRFCINCNKEIPEGRLKALPDTDTCVDCSDVDKVRGFRIISGKTTYTELQLVDEKKFKELTRKQARIGSSPGKGIWMNPKFAGKLKM